jgi:hypothetical protein
MLGVLTLMVLGAGGCASDDASGRDASMTNSTAGATTDPSSELRIDASQYAAAFEAAREAILDARFEIERVDAYAGVITSRPGSQAINTLDDAISRQEKVVTITFVPILGEASAASPAGADQAGALARGEVGVAELGVPMTMRTSVEVRRIQTPGWRPSSSSVIATTRTIDPALEQRGLMPRNTSRLRDDPETAKELTRNISRRMRGPGAN